MQFNCTICNKPYKSYQSLWNHNKKFHPKVENDDNNKPNIETHVIKCTYCNAVFTTRQAKSLHIKKYCKQKQEIDAKKAENKEALQLQILKQETKLKKEETNRIKEEAKILKLKQKLEKAEKENTNLTPKKINKNLENFETHSNKPLLCDLHKINIHGLLTREEKINIANKRYGSLEALVETIYCGKENKYKVVIVNNSNNNNINLFMEKHNGFILEDKRSIAFGTVVCSWTGFKRTRGTRFLSAWHIITNPTSRILPIVLGIFGYTYGSLLGLFLLGALTKNRGCDRGNLFAMATGFLVVAVLSGLPSDLLKLFGLPPLPRPNWLPLIAFPWRITFGTLTTFLIAFLFRSSKPTPTPPRASFSN